MRSVDNRGRPAWYRGIRENEAREAEAQQLERRIGALRFRLNELRTQSLALESKLGRKVTAYGDASADLERAEAKVQATKPKTYTVHGRLTDANNTAVMFYGTAAPNRDPDIHDPGMMLKGVGILLHCLPKHVIANHTVYVGEVYFVGRETRRNRLGRPMSVLVYSTKPPKGTKHKRAVAKRNAAMRRRDKLRTALAPLIAARAQVTKAEREVERAEAKLATLRRR